MFSLVQTEKQLDTQTNHSSYMKADELNTVSEVIEVIEVIGSRSSHFMFTMKRRNKELYKKSI